MGFEEGEPHGGRTYAKNSSALADVTAAPVADILAEPLGEAYGQDSGGEVHCCVRLTPVWAAALLAAYLLAAYCLAANLLLPLSLVVPIFLLVLLPFMAFLGVGWAASNRDTVSANRILLAMVAGAVMFGLAFFVEAIVQLVAFFIVFASSGVELQFVPCYLFLASHAAVTASIQEVAKLCTVTLATIPITKRMNPLGLTIMSMTGALTMATIETLKYMFTFARWDGTLLDTVSAAGKRELLYVPFNACTGIIIGACLARMFAETRRREANGEEGPSTVLCMARSLVVPVIMHFLWDAVVIEPSCLISMTGVYGQLLIDWAPIGVCVCTAAIALVTWKQLVPISSVNVPTRSGG